MPSDKAKNRESKARRALLDSATVLLAANPGASFIEVAQAAGVGRATLYRHFPTREDLIRTLTLEAIDATDQASSELMTQVSSATEMLYRTLEAMVPLGDRYYFLTRLPELDDEEIRGHIDRQNRQLTQLIEAAQKENGINPELPSAWAASVINGLIYSAWASLAEGKFSETQLRTLITRTLQHGLSAR